MQILLTMIVAFALFVLSWCLRLRSLLGSSGSEKLPAKGWGRVPESRNLVRFLAVLMLVIVTLSLVSGILSGATEPFTVSGELCSLLTLFGYSVTLLVWVLSMMARSIRGLWHRVSRQLPPLPGEEGGVRDDWLDGPQASLVKSRPGRSAASG